MKQENCRTVNYSSLFSMVSEFSISGHDESGASVNRGNYSEILNVFALYDSDLHSHLESSSVVCGSSPDIHNELIHSISGVMTMEIKQEISRNNFVFFNS
jgi:hypothetical protein